MNAVFLDTVGLIAVWDLADQWNTAADAAYQIVIQQGQRLATTPLILWECGNAAARRPFRQRVNTLRHYLLQEGLLIEPTAQEIEEAWAAYDRGEAGQAGIADLSRSR
ncbi:MAG: type II toxin-antitoxin system VapC family toxin [Isosphaeraceae bacterium]